MQPNTAIIPNQGLVLKGAEEVVELIEILAGLAHTLLKKSVHLDEETTKKGESFKDKITREVADVYGALDALKYNYGLDERMIEDLRAYKFGYYLGRKLP